jgi:hypothetical protein
MHHRNTALLGKGLDLGFEIVGDPAQQGGLSVAMIKYAESRSEKSSESRTKSTFCIIDAGGKAYDSQGGIHENFGVT